MSYTFSWEIKSELNPSDFLTWEIEDEDEVEESLFVDTPDFDVDEIL